MEGKVARIVPIRRRFVETVPLVGLVSSKEKDSLHRLPVETRICQQAPEFSGRGGITRFLSVDDQRQGGADDNEGRCDVELPSQPGFSR